MKGEKHGDWSQMRSGRSVRSVRSWGRDFLAPFGTSSYAGNRLTRAIASITTREDERFNDHLCSNIEELRETIRFACALAAVYPPDRLPHAPRRPARYAPAS